MRTAPASVTPRGNVDLTILDHGILVDTRWSTDGLTTVVEGPEGVIMVQDHASADDAVAWHMAVVAELRGAP